MVGTSQALPLRSRPVPFVETDLTSAQMIKYASNAFLATRISFMNELAGLCVRLGADVTQIAEGMGYDARIGHDYLQAGLGFGGPCIEKDLSALLKIAENNDYAADLLQSVLLRNDQQVRHVVSKVKELIGYLLYRKIVAVYSLTFKAGTNDVRNSLSLRVIDRLKQEGALVQAHDPKGGAEAKALHPDLAVYDDPYEAAGHADALMILTDWPEYLELDYAEVKRRMARPAIVDGRNMLDRDTLVANGFQYLGIGRLSRD